MPCQLSFGMLDFSSLMSKETRLSPRTRIQAQIVFKIPTQKTRANFVTLYSENISEGGVFLKSPSRQVPFKVGMVLDLHFSLPNHPALIRSRGKVIWTTEGWSDDLQGINGIGIQFIDIKPEFREVIRRFVSENLDK